MVMFKASDKLYRFLDHFNALGGDMPSGTKNHYDNKYPFEINLSLSSGLIEQAGNCYKLTAEGIKFLVSYKLEKEQNSFNYILMITSILIVILSIINFLFEQDIFKIVTKYDAYLVFILSGIIIGWLLKKYTCELRK